LASHQPHRRRAPRPSAHLNEVFYATRRARGKGETSPQCTDASGRCQERYPPTPSLTNPFPSDHPQVPTKQQGRKRAREREKPLSGLNIDELLGTTTKRARVDPRNPIPTFKQTLATTDDVSTFQTAVNDLAKVVYSLITNSVGDSRYGQAIECIRVMREEMTELEEPAIFNGFMRELKKKIFAGELNGNRRDMWMKMRMNRVGLIDQKLSPFSEVQEEEAREFFKPPA
jgi:ATP-dependent DNA helicase 2 subunit 2